jgi:hypothetical protein
MFRLRLILLVAIAVVGCSKKPDAAAPEVPPQPDAAPQPAAAWRYELDASGPAPRLYAVDPAGGERVLIRVLGPGKTLSETELARLASEEAPLTDRWQAAKAAVVSKPLDSPESRHDAWLEVAERLEECRDDAPAHLGILRDLLSAYGNLLAFESTTSLGSNLCLLASERAAEYERLASPPDASDARLLRLLRASLFLVMKNYPCATEQLASLDGPEAATLRRMMEAVGQAQFAEVERFTIGPLEVRVCRTRGGPPDGKLLWSQLYLIICPPGGPVPHRTMCYTLSRNGEGGDLRYSLYFASLNRSSLVQLYGDTPPDYADLREQVESSVRQALAQATEAKR